MEMRRIGPPALGEAVAERLLDLLSTDDAFRAEFVRDPAKAMELAGYAHQGPEVAHPGFRYQVTNLASKENIRRDREKLKRAFNAIQNFTAPDELIAL